MIDHVSIAVRDLNACGLFYDAVLTAIGFSRLVTRPGTIGFGKKYPEFWLNERRNMTPVATDSGVHFCLRARDVAAVQAFHAAALQNGGADDGTPGPRSGEMKGYYAAFIRDPEGNRLEAATFTAG